MARVPRLLGDAPRQLYPDGATTILEEVNADAGRTWHYRDFYRPAGTPPAERLPLWLVIGNCQAEALRLTLDAVVDRPYRTARIPPVHELEPADLPYLRVLLSEAAVLVSQPIRDNYRGLPVGSAELRAQLSPGATVVRWPVIRDASLYPFQVIVRHPADRAATPPLVPYHDLRTVAAARDGRDPDQPWDVEVTEEQIRAAAQASRAELARRERRDTDVGISDALASFGAQAAHTINHPGNPVFYELATRILDFQGVRGDVPSRDRQLLSSAYAPLEPRVLTALGITGTARPQWCLNGETLTPDQVHAAQLCWYHAHPDYIRLAVERHGHLMELLGLTASARRPPVARR